ncbi:hypothetical protein MTO96_044639, partial [Rhipicephalus appendiculatus]
AQIFCQAAPEVGQEDVERKDNGVLFRGFRLQMHKRVGSAEQQTLRCEAGTENRNTSCEKTRPKSVTRMSSGYETLELSK